MTPVPTADRFAAYIDLVAARYRPPAAVEF